MKRKLLCAFAACLGLQLATAQVSAYGFTQTSGTYGSMLTGSFVGGPGQDDDVNYVTLPFSFTFNGTAYTNLEVCSNGYVSFSTLTGSEYYPLSDLGTQEVISPFGQDIFAGVAITGDFTAGSNSITNVSFLQHLQVGDSILDIYGDFLYPFPTITNIVGTTIVLNYSSLNNATGQDIFTLNGAIRENVSGTTPNRIYTLEWRNYTRYGVYDEMINFKLKLYETSNKIEVVYGPIVASTDPYQSEVGLKGTSSSDFNSREVTSSNTWATSSPASTISDVCDFHSQKKPANGQTYIWAPSCALPNFTLAQSSASSCAGQPVTLTGSGATTYSWSGIGSTAQVTVNPTSTTTYTLYGSSGSCTLPLMITHTVIGGPAVNVTRSSTVTCAGQNLTLTATGANSYTWTGHGNNAEIVITPSTSTSYTVMGANSGCGTQVIIDHSVIPLPNVQVVPSKTPWCQFTSGSLTASGAGSYAWSNGSVTPVIVITPTAATTTFTVTGTDNGCAKTFTYAVNAVICNGVAEYLTQETVDVYPNPFTESVSVKNQSGQPLTIAVTDVTGKIIYRSSVTAFGGQVISAGDWAAGIYFISARSGDSMVIKKIVKE